MRLKEQLCERRTLRARNADRLHQIARGIQESGGKADVFPVDVRLESVKELADHIKTERIQVGPLQVVSKSAC